MEEALKRAREGVNGLLAATEHGSSLPFNNRALGDSKIRVKVFSTLSQLSDSIEQVSAMEEQLKNAKEKLRNQRLDVHRQFAYVNALTPEILRNIFSAACSSFLNVGERLDFAFAVSQVSKTWRHIARSQCELWCSIQIQYGVGDLTRIDAILPLSANRPLQIHFDGSFNSDDDSSRWVPAVQSIINKTFARWQYLSFTNPDEDLTDLLTHIQFPTVKYLDFSGLSEGEGWEYEQERILDIIKAPALQYFAFADLDEYTPILDPASEIIIKGEVSLDTLTSILSNCSRLETLEFSMSLKKDIALFTPSESIRTLAVSVDAESFISLMACFRGHWGNIRRLGLAFHGIHPGKEGLEKTLITSFFSHVISVKDLKIVAHFDFAKTILQILSTKMKKRETGKHVRFLLLLKSLRLRILRPSSSSSDASDDFNNALVRFVSKRGAASSRRDPTYARLRQVSVVDAKVDGISATLAGELDEFYAYDDDSEWWPSMKVPYSYD